MLLSKKKIKKKKQMFHQSYGVNKKKWYDEIYDDYNAIHQ